MGQPKTIAVFSGKGGVGKSLIACSLAQLTNRILIDTDPQLSSSDWGDLRTSPPEVISAQMGRIPALVQKYQECIIDTPGAITGNGMAALRAVDLILVPTGDRQPELNAVPATLDVAAQAGKPVVLVLNRLHPFTDPTPVKAALEELGSIVCPVVLRERSAHYKAVALGQSALEYEPDGAAATEIRALWDWIQENVA